MRRLFMVGSVTTLLVSMVSMPWAATNLNSSRSNIYRLVYSAGGMTSKQAAALGAELDKTAKVDAMVIKQALQKLFIPTNFKLISIIPGKPITVLLLTNPADEAQARHIAVSDSGAVGTKSPPKK